MPSMAERPPRSPPPPWAGRRQKPVKAKGAATGEKKPQKHRRFPRPRFREAKAEAEGWRSPSSPSSALGEVVGLRLASLPLPEGK